MLETEEQRRWWFANHPEYSTGRRKEKTGKPKEAEHEKPKVPPKEVDEYVDQALLTATGPLAALMKSVKRHFGTEGWADETTRETSGQAAAGPRMLTDEELARQIEIDKQGIIADPHTFLDIAPVGRFITTPLKALRGLLRSMAKDVSLSREEEGDSHASRITAQGSKGTC